MKKASIRPITLPLSVLLIGLVTLSGCAFNQKSWVQYNDQVELLSDNDRALFLDAVQNTLEHTPSNTTVRWLNSEGVVAGTVTPVRTLKKNSGVFCRVYKAAFVEEENAGGSSAAACRNSDGVWDIVNPGRIGS